MKILGLSFFYHDSAAVLLLDGKPIAMAEEERFSRKKHDSRYPQNAIDFVLARGGVGPTDLDYVVFYEKPFLKLERIMKNSLSTFPWGCSAFIDSAKNLFISKLWVRELIVKCLGIDSKKVLFGYHHLSHAASAFFCSPYEEAAILTIDGVGELAVTTIGVGKDNQINILKEINFPNSLGLFYSAFTAFLGFEVNEGEYKVMGMAPYGKPTYEKEIKRMIRFLPDGSYELNMDYFSFHNSTTQTFSDKFVKLLGEPRDSKSRFFTRQTGWPVYFGDRPDNRIYEKMALEQERYADIAASVQKVLEEAIINLANAAYQVTGLNKLCFAGGVALNSVANRKILQHTPFGEIFIQPAAGDAGGALGAALSVYHMVLGNPRSYIMGNAYYGASYSNEDIKHFLETNQINHQFLPEPDLIEAVAESIANGKIVGWFQGRFEWGPRALGSRSILADPRREDMKDIVNVKIKFREPYRPFAPSVLAEEAGNFFDLPDPDKSLPARFMLYVVDVFPEKRNIIPAVTHVDGTARPQLVFANESARYYSLIKKFKDKTGIPLLLNTSFNLKGEPIVNSPADAYSTFQRSGIDILVLENYLIKK